MKALIVAVFIVATRGGVEVIKHIRNKANETIQGYEGDTFDLTEQDDSGG